MFANIDKTGWTEEDYEAYCKALASIRNGALHELNEIRCHNAGLRSQIDYLKEYIAKHVANDEDETMEVGAAVSMGY